MTPLTAIGTCLRNYVTFSGRARRSEFWWFWLFFVVGALALSTVDTALFGTTEHGPRGDMMDGMEPGMDGVSYRSEGGPITAIFVIGTFLPYVAVTVRRLHDRDMSGFWIFLSFLPLVGSLALLVILAFPGTEGPNRFGPDPLGRGDGPGGGGRNDSRTPETPEEDYSLSGIPKVDR